MLSKTALYDVLVVGGGLAGLGLAIQCAAAGRRVVVFEKETYPFHKVCGEYISLESWNFLKRIGLDIDELRLPIINNLVVSDVHGKEFPFKLSPGGFGISRYSLDNQLYKRALEEKVEVITGKVEEITFTGYYFKVKAGAVEINARVVAGGFGKKSNLDVKWKREFAKPKETPLNNFIGVKYHIQHNHPRDRIYLHNFRGGYCGMSAIEEGKSCLCYLTTADNLRRNGNVIGQMEKQVLFANGRLKEIFESANFLYGQPLTISQVSFSRKEQVYEHVLLLGDAAGMISPLCGNGMSMAMHASLIAFEWIEKFLSGLADRQEMEEGYTKAWKKKFVTRLWAGRLVQRLFGNDRITSEFLKIMYKFPPLSSAIIKSTHGQPF